MTRNRETVACPRCGADAEIESWEEYQGVRPHGGYVTRTQATDKNCSCEWDDDDYDDMMEHAARKSDFTPHNFTPEEIYEF
jgi:hypothetical protein